MDQNFEFLELSEFHFQLGDENPGQLLLILAEMLHNDPELLVDVLRGNHLQCDVHCHEGTSEEDREGNRCVGRVVLGQHQQVDGCSNYHCVCYYITVHCKDGDAPAVAHHVEQAIHYCV